MPAAWPGFSASTADDMAYTIGDFEGYTTDTAVTAPLVFAYNTTAGSPPSFIELVQLVGTKEGLSQAQRCGGGL